MKDSKKWENKNINIFSVLYSVNYFRQIKPFFHEQYVVNISILVNIYFQ
jgi:hypothetical protein